MVKRKKAKKRKKFVNTRYVSSSSSESESSISDGDYYEKVVTPDFSELEESESDNPELNVNNNNKSKKARLDESKRKKGKRVIHTESETDSSIYSSECSTDETSEEEARSRSRAKAKRRRHKKRASDKRREKTERRSRPKVQAVQKSRSRKSKHKQKKRDNNNYVAELEKLRAEIESLKSSKGETQDSVIDPMNEENFKTPVRKPDNNKSKSARNKSWSDTTLYAPAVPINNAQGNMPTVTGVSPNLARETNNQRNKQFNEEVISNFIKQIRVANVAGDGQGTRSSVRSEVVVPGGNAATSRESAQPMDSNQQAQLDARAHILAAEKYKANLTPSGNPLTLYNDPDDDFFHTTCHIDLPLKQRIQRGEFVELEKLLAKKSKLNQARGDEQRMEIVNKDGKAFLTPAIDRDNKIYNIHRWDQAFRVYATIYSEANPLHAAEIWQYIDVIHRAARAFNWENVANYDYVFRQLMAANPNRKWSKTYTQMWNLNLCEPLAKVSPANNAKVGGRSAKPDGICWRYNKNKCKYGDECRFEHRCSYCLKMGHPASKCFKKHGTGKGKKKSSSENDKGSPVK